MFLKLDALLPLCCKHVPERRVERYQTTLDEYYSFIEEFPQSKFSKDVARIFESTAKFLKVDTSVQQTENN
jgi:outer membrane protein assembly factor BamD